MPKSAGVEPRAARCQDSALFRICKGQHGSQEVAALLRASPCRRPQRSGVCVPRERVQPVTRFIPCLECGGTGHTWFFRGGVDPAAHTIGPCEHCHHDGHERCSECQAPLTDAWIEPSNADYGERAYPLCAMHMQLYQEEAAG